MRGFSHEAHEKAKDLLQAYKQGNESWLYKYKYNYLENKITTLVLLYIFSKLTPLFCWLEIADLKGPSNSNESIIGSVDICHLTASYLDKTYVR